MNGATRMQGMGRRLLGIAMTGIVATSLSACLFGEDEIVTDSLAGKKDLIVGTGIDNGIYFTTTSLASGTVSQPYRRRMRMSTTRNHAPSIAVGISTSLNRTRRTRSRATTSTPTAP